MFPVTPEEKQMQRRQCLFFIVKLMLFSGVFAFVFILISSLSSTDVDEEATTDTAGETISLAELKAGQIRRISRGYQEVWVYHRRKADIKNLQQSGLLVEDPQSNLSRQPPAMQTALRSLNEKYFVFIPLESKRQCQVQWDNNRQLFYDPCYGALFDTAGRRLKGTGHAEQTSLPVPDYEFVAEGQLRLLSPAP